MTPTAGRRWSRPPARVGEPNAPKAVGNRPTPASRTLATRRTSRSTGSSTIMGGESRLGRPWKSRSPTSAATTSRSRGARKTFMPWPICCCVSGSNPLAATGRLLRAGDRRRRHVRDSAAFRRARTGNVAVRGVSGAKEKVRFPRRAGDSGRSPEQAAGRKRRPAAGRGVVDRPAIPAGVGWPDGGGVAIPASRAAARRHRPAGRLAFKGWRRRFGIFGCIRDVYYTQPIGARPNSAAGRSGAAWRRTNTSFWATTARFPTTAAPGPTGGPSSLSC